MIGDARERHSFHLRPELLNGQQGCEAFFFSDGVMDLVTIHLGREERYWLLLAVFIPLEQHCTDSDLGCIALDEKVPLGLYCQLCFWTQGKLLISRLLQRFRERGSQSCKVLYEPTVPTSGSKKGSHFLHGPWLRHPPNSCYTPWIHPQTSSTHYEAEAFSDSAKILQVRSFVRR
ncbi:uncharacterized protein LOC128263824 [Drosophila gunungcola]|uniref:uncharacterized protein LOC128263824 n=1 Tax=Drosophila gunungcola TaxID=103775 RepID=UPI0022E126F8|nr:uncharacterized protein LOC128263824 [Drosophila gunungcola]